MIGVERRVQAGLRHDPAVAGDRLERRVLLDRAPEPLLENRPEILGRQRRSTGGESLSVRQRRRRPGPKPCRCPACGCPSAECTPVAAWPHLGSGVRSTAMTEAGRRQRSLGLVERVAALHRVKLFADIPGRVLAAVAEAAVEQRLTRRESAHGGGRGRGAPLRHRRRPRPSAPWRSHARRARPGGHGGRARRAGARAARRVGDRPGADARSCGSTRWCSTSSSWTGPSSPRV